MSVKQMTSNQLQDDLEAISRTWPGGIPPEQSDRVNALKGELKRRGEDTRTTRANAPGGKPRAGDIKSMTDDQLSDELLRLSKENGMAGDEELQTRFADVRFEIRQRAKSATPSSPSVSPRSIEIPETEVTKTVSDFQNPEVLKAKPEPRAIASSVKGFSFVTGQSCVIFKYTAQDQFGNVSQVAAKMSTEEVEDFIAMARAAVGQ